MRVRSSCAVDVAVFPFDSQMCHYEVGSWMYSIGDVKPYVASSEMDISHLIQNSEWNLTHTLVEANGTLDFEGFVIPIIKFHIYITRRLSFASLALVAPCLLLTVLTGMMFYVPPQSGEKIAPGKRFDCYYKYK